MTSTDLLAAPNDDLPRLIYADWLDEHGEPERAEFIRAMIAHPKCFVGECNHRDYLRRIEGEPCPDAVGKSLEYLRASKDFGKPILGSYLVSRNYDGATLTIARGFPDEIRCTLTQWVGVVCGLCEWEGGQRRKELKLCSKCHGTGRVPGIAGRVCGAWPVTKVVLTDCEPVRCDNRYTWWCLVQNRHGHQVIDRLIWEELKGYFEYGGGRPVLLKWYPSKELALTALSDAAIRYGRKLAAEKLKETT